MEFPHARKSLNGKNLEDTSLEKFRRNDEVYRNTMERIFQKYSNLEDPGLDVCLKTMTFRTRKGTVPIDSAEAERELQHLRSLVDTEHSLQVLDSSREEQAPSEQDVDVTQRTENTDTSNQKDNSDDSLWHGTETFQLSMNSVSGSLSCSWGEPSQHEEEDEDLEKTFNSHGSTLVDVYPSMLNQIGDAYRRQQKTKAARAVLRRYRHMRWRSAKVQLNSKSHAANKTTESSLAVQKLPHSDMTSCHKDVPSYQGSRNQDFSPLRNTRNPSHASIRSSQELSPLKSIRNPSLTSIRSSQELSPLKNLQNSPFASIRNSPELSHLKNLRNSPFASIRSSQDLSPLKSIRSPSLASIRSSQEVSPLKSIRSPSLASSKCNQELSQLKSIRNSSLVSSSCFYSPRRDFVEESPESKQTGSYVPSVSESQPVRVFDRSTSSTSSMSSPCSPSPDLNQTYNVEPIVRPPSQGVSPCAVCSPSQAPCNSAMKGAQNSTNQGGRLVASSPSLRHHSPFEKQFTGAFVDKDCCMDHLSSSTHSSQQALTGDQFWNGERSLLKPRGFRLENEEQTSSSVYYPKRTLPMNPADTLEVYRSPYRRKQRVYGSRLGSHRSFSEHQENLSVADGHQFSPRPKRQRSSSASDVSSRQIDAEFRSIYHHFICRGTYSLCRTSSCYLCERSLEGGIRSPPAFSSNMSALALTPIHSRLKKRPRQCELEEYLQQKRFRESSSPTGHRSSGPKHQQLGAEYVRPSLANPKEDKQSWNRAFLLQCPSPGFLRASGGIKSASRSRLGQQLQSHSPWRDTTGYIGANETTSPSRAWNRSGVSASPSVSRRRLLYEPLQ